MQTTALVNEVYLQLVDCDQIDWKDRAHFFGVSAQLMRRILIDFTRSRGYQKRGGGTPHLSLDEAPAVCSQPDTSLVVLDVPLNALATVGTGRERRLRSSRNGGRPRRRTPVDEESAEGFVLALQRELGARKNFGWPVWLSDGSAGLQT